MANNKTDYFKLIEEQLGYTLRAAQKLAEVLTGFDPARLEIDREELHVIERQGDLKAHDIQDKVSKEFITPIDREDIAEIVQAIDDITDSLDDVLIRAYIYNIKAVRPEALRFSQILVSCGETMAKVAAEFGNFRKSATIKDEIIKLNLLEEDGDAVYTEAMAKLFREPVDYLDTIAWMNLFEVLENSCDSFERVSDLFERVIMKNM